MDIRSVRQANPQFIGKAVKTILFQENLFIITFTDDSYIHVETDDEPLEYDFED